MGPAQGYSSSAFHHQVADRIVVLRSGSIIEERSHHSPLPTNGHYAELDTTYFRHQNLEYVQAAGALS